MKLLSLAVILSCCLVHVYCDECTAAEIQTIQQQWTDTFRANPARLFEFAMAAVFRMVGQGTAPPPGGAAATGRIMARLGEVIQLLSNPEELQARIEAFRAQQNLEDGGLQARMLAFLESGLQTLPEFVGESYDEDAWRDCLTMLVMRLTESSDSSSSS